MNPETKRLLEALKEQQRQLYLLAQQVQLLVAESQRLIGELEIEVGKER